MLVQQFSLLSTRLSVSDINNLYNDGITSSKAIAESFKFTDAVVDSVSETLARLTETLNFSVTQPLSLQAKKDIEFVLKFSEDIYISVKDGMTEQLDYQGTFSSVHKRLAVIVEKLMLREDYDLSNLGIDHIALLLAFQDDIRVVNKNQIIESLTFNDDFRAKYRGYIKLVETILFDHTSIPGNITVVITENLVFSNAVSQTAQLIEVIRNKLDFVMGITVLDENYLAYTYNTESGGITEYSNYPFNSFSYPYAASKDGIYVIDDSESDDGDLIKASIRTGLMDFGTSLKKQVPYAYLGITDNGRVLLKTISNNTGVKNERWYEVRSYNSALDTTRVRMGKGIKAKYWQFELSNIDGEDFKLESMELLPVVLKRRKQ